MLCNCLLVSECRLQGEGAHLDRRGLAATNNVGLKVCFKHLVACILIAGSSTDLGVDTLEARIDTGVDLEV